MNPFRYVTTPYRVFAGDDALTGLGGETERLGAERVRRHGTLARAR
jgi:hypothetical protein